MRLVLDTNVIVAAMRSPTGASAALLMAARRGEVTLVANVALALEYEATCCRPEHGIAAGLSPAQVSIFLDAVIAMVAPVETHFFVATAVARSRRRTGARSRRQRPRVGYRDV
ncbi:PIN domain-containing protein [Candidatus Accumulibacter phosphatis]|uniref:PIN domain-containing protein n=1 Tax=Candidatus Accumulibacter phosphatis TaxID=327160 RepID=UPI0030138E86